MDEFRPIPGYEGVYKINRNGVVINSKGHVLSTIEVCGATAVQLYSSGLRELKPVSTLILETFGEEHYEQ